MATLGRTIRVSSFSSASRRMSTSARTVSSSSPPALFLKTVSQLTNKSRLIVTCSAVQESSASAVANEKKEVKKAPGQEAPPAAAKPKPTAAKPAAKPLPEMMEDDVIPPLKATLEAQEDVSEVELSFQDNKLEGSFLKKDNPYTFWAFFPGGNLKGAKGFSISSHGSGASTVEPFLVDEKKPTAKHVVFCVEKRLAAQGIIPVWQE